MSSIDSLTLFAFVAALLGVGWYAKRSTLSESAFLVADRGTGLFALTATLVMTEFNSATLISFASLGYGVGLWALTLPCIFLIGLLFYAVTVAEKWKEYDGLSVAGFFTQRYGSAIGKLASAFLILAMCGFCATYIKSLYLLLSPLFPFFGQWVTTAILVALVLVMSLRGGLFSVIHTDVVSFLLLVIVFPLIAYFSWVAPSGQKVALPLSEAAQVLPPRFLCSLVALTMFTYILAPWYGQKIFAAQSKKVAYRAVVLAAILVCILYGLAVFSTAMLRMKGVECGWEASFPTAIQQGLPLGLRGLSFGLLFAISATTMTGVWSAMTAMVVADFLGGIEKGNCGRSRFLTVGFACMCFLLANLLVDRVFDKLILANIPILALSFALLAGFYWERATRFGAYCSMITGLVCGIFAYLYWGEAGCYTWYWTMGGIPLIFASGIVGSLVTDNKRTIRVEPKH